MAEHVAVTKMSNYGIVPEFTPGQNTSWAAYTERLEFYFEANAITEDNIKRAIFLTVCGEHVYNLVRSLVTPSKPKDVGFDVMLTLLNEHFAPRPNEIVQRFHFYKRVQLPGETIMAFVADLRKLSEFCEFENLEKALRDRLVCGIKDEYIQRRLMSESTLTFQKAMDMAVAAETANTNVSSLRDRNDVTLNPGGSQEVYALHRKPERGFAKPGMNNSKHLNTKEFNSRKCYRCEGEHLANACKFKEAVCHYCKKTGHLMRVCFKQKKDKGQGNLAQKFKSAARSQPSKGAHRLEPTEEETIDEYSMYNLHEVMSKDPVMVKLKLNGVVHEMEVDSGAARSIISDKTYTALWKEPPKLKSCRLHLDTWSKQKIQSVGTVEVNVQYKNIKQLLVLTVMQGDGVSLIGRDWFAALGLYVGGVRSMAECKTFDYEEFHELFQEGLGEYKGVPVAINVKKDANPIFKKSRQISFVLRERVNDELDRLAVAGVIEPVAFSQWATPIVPIQKKDGSIRLCGDYKCTVNLAIETDTYPLPTFNESFASLAGGKFFTKLDLEQAYTQIKVDNKTADFLTWNTPKGLFRVKRLPFGVKMAPGLFQRIMSTRLADIEGVVVLLDDILIMGTSAQEHWHRVKVVLQRLVEAGLRLKREKCVFGAKEVTFLGYKVDESGIHPTDAKIKAIREAPAPTEKSQLQAFLGLYNFYERFLRDKATVLEPLHRLLDLRSPWKWGKKENHAFEEAKKLLSSEAVLVHYDMCRPLVLICDASPYGVGAVLTHVMENGMEKPIAFGSRTLQKHERNYAQIDREALAICFGVCKFKQYLYGRKFKIITDHKPLLGLLHPEKQTPAVMSPRMLRWSIMLNAYDYTLEHRPGTKIQNADGLSRLPLKSSEQTIPGPSDVLLLESPNNIPITVKQVAEASKKDEQLTKVLKWTKEGWPNSCPEENMKPFWCRREELSIHKECLLFGNRVVVPEQLRGAMLKLLHGVHQGVVHTKAVARSYIWWPGLDKQIEMTVKSCDTCMVQQNNPRRETSTHWVRPKRAWSRLHIDFAGPFYGHLFFIVVDAFSGWPEVVRVKSTSAETVVSELRKILATHGIPDIIVSDNGTGFTAEQCQNFFERNGIRHIRSAPFHPSTNGTAERMVQTIKRFLKKLKQGDWETRLSRVLFAIRTTPRTSTGKCPGEMLMNRQLRTRWHQLHPDWVDECGEDELVTSETKRRAFEVGDYVAARNYVPKGDKWIPGVVEAVKGTCSYTVKLNNGNTVNRHLDQLLKGLRPEQPTEVPIGETEEKVAIKEADKMEQAGLEMEPAENDLSRGPESGSVLRRSDRSRSQPVRFKDFQMNNLRGEDCYSGYFGDHCVTSYSRET